MTSSADRVRRLSRDRRCENGHRHHIDTLTACALIGLHMIAEEATSSSFSGLSPELGGTQNIRFPLSFLFFRCHCMSFAMTCKFCNAWRPKQSNFNNALFKLHFAWQNVLQQCSFLRVIAFFSLRTEKLDVQEEVFAIAK